MIRAVVADDEVLARQKLLQLLKDIDDIELVGECANGTETIELLALTMPQVIFLDIRLSDMDGFDVLERLSSDVGTPLPYVIFVTADAQCAMRAFEISAIDYLLKPFTRERLKAAVQRLRDRLATDETKPTELDEKREDSYASRLAFRSRGRILFLSVNEIRWIKAKGNYVRIFAGKDSHLLRETTTNLLNRFDPNSFVRVHRSAAINLRYLKEVRNTSDGGLIAVLNGGQEISVARSYRARIQKLLKFE